MSRKQPQPKPDGLIKPDPPPAPPPAKKGWEFHDTKPGECPWLIINGIGGNWAKK